MAELEAIMSSSFVRVKIVAFVHFIFIANAMFGIWVPTVYLYYNILFIVSLFWSIHCKESSDAVHTAALVNACSIIFDLVVIIAFFDFSRHNGWSAAFSIINLICRPFSLLLLHREFTERGGSLSTATIFPTRQQRNYEDIDRPNQPVPTNSQSPNSPNVASIF